MAKDGREWLKKEKAQTKQKSILRPFQESTSVPILQCWVLGQCFTEFVSQTLKKSWLPHYSLTLPSKPKISLSFPPSPEPPWKVPPLSPLYSTQGACVSTVHYLLALYPSGSDHSSQIILRYFRNCYIRTPPVLKSLFLHFPQLYIGRSKKQKLLPA